MVSWGSRKIGECWVGQQKESILPGFFDFQGKRNGLHNDGGYFINFS